MAGDRAVGRTSSNRQKTRCPECLAPIYLKDDAELWDPITCPECHTSLEVVSLRPLALDYMAEEEGEDEDWDGDFEET
jgi:lysine biosynthesis protein LysW